MDNNSTFHVSRNDLEDGSATFDVWLSSDSGQELVAEPASENTANQLAWALEVLRGQILDCGSDLQVNMFCKDLSKFFCKHAKGGA